MPIRVITTEDGSQSLYNEEMNETYHSTKGALGESKYVFIEKGLDYFVQKNNSKSVNVLEIGLGTGLNALLTHQYAETREVNIYYTTLEPFPLSVQLVDSLIYQSFDQEIFRQIHSEEWEKKNTLSPFFHFQKHQSTLENFHTDLKFDVIYFDAFAPSKQPEVWSLENLQKCFDYLNPNSILTTYCAQGQFKRNLKSIGFEIELLQGAMGKKEMVRASSPNF